ncbi:MAG: substrate-binding domain-containing protein, partial [Anaerolineae bacterium]|nr:substrate-binding domain-containing protein [Anaerolineae bacterium]
MITGTKEEVIQTIADRAGVSVQVVTQVLSQPVNSRTPIMQQAINALTSDGHGVFVCFLYPRINLSPSVRPLVVDDYTGNILHNLYAFAKSKDYNLDYYVAYESLADTSYYQRLIQKYPLGGLISIIPINSRLIIEACDEFHYPHLFIDYQGEEDISAHYSIDVNNREGIRQVMTHLIGLGHRRIGFITGVLSMASARERLTGYQEALEQAAIPYDPALVKEGDWVSDSARRQTESLLQITPPITAIVASNDMQALGAMMTINEAGLQIPADISLTGFDDISITSHVSPRLTTVRQPIASMGT